MRSSVLVLAVVWVAGCSPWAAPEPDLSAIYGRAARHASPLRNPVVVIPGLTGSRLEDRVTGRPVWGTIGGDWASGDDPEGMRLSALPMAEGVPFAELRDEVEAVGVLDRVEIKFLGLPLEFKAYHHILEALGVGGYRDIDGALDVLDYGEGHFTCFQFPYDWRRSNVETARRFEEFLAETRLQVQAEIEARYGIADAEVKFDLVAHSMGAVMARYFLRYGGAPLPEDGSLPPLTWAGAEWVERAVMVAPPNAGAVGALEQLLNGRKFAPLIPRYRAAVLGTYPSGYELLPRSRFGSVRVDGEAVADLFDVELWQREGWGLADPREADVLEAILPQVPEPEVRRRIALDHLRRSLDSARAFTEALDRPARPPAGVELLLIAGDAEATARTVEVTRPSELKTVAYGPGDGKVLRSSALMDEREAGPWSPRLISPIHWEDTLFLFESHLRITKDAAFTDNLLYWLLEEPRPGDPMRLPRDDSRH